MSAVHIFYLSGVFQMDCVNVCTDKGINFNQRHMMVFVEHQNAKQKLAAKAAEEAAAVKTSQSEDAAASPLQRPDASGLPSMAGDVEPGSVAQASGSSPLLGAQQDTSATGPVPQTVCWRGDRNLPHTAFSPISSSSDNYVGQSVIDQYLLSRPGMLKYV